MLFRSEEGQHTEELILSADEVVKSPGIPNDAPMILKLKEQGTPIISEIEFAGRYTNAKMICITGSNGKTTTTSLIYHIFKSAGLNVGLAGNIGKSLALQVATDQHDYYVIELSSFQLDNMYKFRANIAVLMNITPDHLDRYDHCMQNYVDAKFRITQNQTPEDAFIFWNDDPIIKRELDKHGLRAHLYPFSAVKEDGAIAYVEDGEVEINEPIAFNMEQEKLALQGTHNLYNSLAAGISANLAGIEKEYIRRALSDFKGVEHRLEKVATVRGVEFINDSKATNVNSCWYALQSMKTKTVLILGGKDKGNDYTEIEDLVREKCSALVYLGLHNEKLHDFFDRTTASCFLSTAGVRLVTFLIKAFAVSIRSRIKLSSSDESTLRYPLASSSVTNIQPTYFPAAFTSSVFTASDRISLPSTRSEARNPTCPVVA